MRALVPNLVFARHHGLLFGLPFLRVVGFFNEHFDPTQVWRWCLRDPEEEKRKRKEKTYPILCERPLSCGVHCSSRIGTPGTSSSSSAPWVTAESSWLHFQATTGWVFVESATADVTNVH